MLCFLNNFYKWKKKKIEGDPRQRNSPLLNIKYIKITIYSTTVKKVGLVRGPWSRLRQTRVMVAPNRFEWTEQAGTGLTPSDTMPISDYC